MPRPKYNSSRIQFPDVKPVFCTCVLVTTVCRLAQPAEIATSAATAIVRVRR